MSFLHQAINMWYLCFVGLKFDRVCTFVFLCSVQDCNIFNCSFIMRLEHIVELVETELKKWHELICKQWSHVPLVLTPPKKAKEKHNWCHLNTVTTQQLFNLQAIWKQTLIRKLFCWFLSIVVWSMWSNQYVRFRSSSSFVPNMYHQISNIRRTKSQNSNVSCLVLSCCCLNLLKPCVKSRMKM